MGILIQIVYIIILFLGKGFLMRWFPDHSIAITLVIFVISVICGILTVKIFGKNKNRDVMIFAATLTSIEIIDPLFEEFLMLI